MKTIKERLVAALHQSVDHFNEGLSPNDSLVKAATDNNFNTEQTTRLVEMFNTARTIHHYKTAEDRRATFELSDPAEVVTAMFDAAPVKKVAFPVLHDYSAYSRPETNYVDPVEEIKVASREYVPAYSMDQLTRMAMKEIGSLKQAAEAAEAESRIAGNVASESLRKLASYVSRGSDVDGLRDTYARLSLIHRGNEWDHVMAKFAEFVPEFYRPTQRDLVKYATVIVIDDSDLGTYEELLKEAQEWMSVEVEMGNHAIELRKEAQSAERELLEIIQEGNKPDGSLESMFTPGMRKAAQLVPGAPVPPRPATPPAGGRGNQGNRRGGPPPPHTVVVDLPGKDKGGDKGSKGGDKSKEKYDVYDWLPGATKTVVEGQQSALKDLAGSSTFMDGIIDKRKASNREASNYLKGVQRSMILQELILTDPVLSGESPETVARAYQSLVEVAPHVALNREVVRSILRQATQSMAISPYDADVWAKLEGRVDGSKSKGRTDD